MGLSCTRELNLRDPCVLLCLGNSISRLLNARFDFLKHNLERNHLTVEAVQLCNVLAGLLLRLHQRLAELLDGHL